MPLTNPKILEPLLKGVREGAPLLKGALGALKNIAYKSTTAPEEFADTLKFGDNLKNVHLLSPEEKEKVLRHQVGDKTGTLLDWPIKGIKSLPFVNKHFPDAKYENLLYNANAGLTHADRAAGETLANKNKAFKWLFTTHDAVPTSMGEDESGKKVVNFTKQEVRRLTAPIDKAKTFILPALAMQGITSYEEMGKKNSSSNIQKREGDVVVQKAATLEEAREQLIDKVAATLASINKTAQTTTPSVNGAPALVKEKITKAAELLKNASFKISSLEEQNEKLAEDNKRLQLQVLAKERSQRAVKLAKDMLRRGMIKQAEYDTQIDYIMKLSDDNFEILNTTVESVPVKKASNESKGLDKMSYLVAESDSNEKPSLSFADAILGLSGNL